MCSVLSATLTCRRNFIPDIALASCGESHYCLHDLIRLLINMLTMQQLPHYKLIECNHLPGYETQRHAEPRITI